MARRDIVDIADFGEGNDFDRSTPKRRRYLLCFVLALLINTSLGYDYTMRTEMIRR
jgi:hypothetical protein